MKTDREHDATHTALRTPHHESPAQHLLPEDKQIPRHPDAIFSFYQKHQTEYIILSPKTSSDATTNTLYQKHPGGILLLWSVEPSRDWQNFVGVHEFSVMLVWFKEFRCFCSRLLVELAVIVLLPLVFRKSPLYAHSISNWNGEPSYSPSIGTATNTKNMFPSANGTRTRDEILNAIDAHQNFEEDASKTGTKPEIS